MWQATEGRSRKVKFFSPLFAGFSCTALCDTIALSSLQAKGKTGVPN